MRDLRKRRGWTQKELAERIGFSSAAGVADIEMKETIQVGLLKRLAEAFDVPIEFFFYEEGIKPGKLREAKVDYHALPLGLRELLESEEGEILKVVEEEIETLALIGSRHVNLSKQAYLEILLVIRRDEGRGLLGHGG